MTAPFTKEALLELQQQLDSFRLQPQQILMSRADLRDFNRWGLEHVQPQAADFIAEHLGKAAGTVFLEGQSDYLFLGHTNDRGEAVVDALVEIVKHRGDQGAIVVRLLLEGVTDLPGDVVTFIGLESNVRPVLRALRVGDRFRYDATSDGLLLDPELAP